MKTTSTALHSSIFTRTMRIVPWRSLDDNKQRYTLVMEWSWNGKVTRDMRYQMSAEEFAGLKTSALEAEAIAKGS